MSDAGCDAPPFPSRLDDRALASSWTPPGNGVPLTVHVEPLDDNGLDSLSATWFPEPPLPLVYPAETSDCLRPLAAEAFADLPGATSMTWIARLHDPWAVAPVDARYIAALDSSGRWGQGAWETAQAAWKADRTSATAAAVASLQAVVDGIDDCDIVDSFEILPYAILECTVAGAEGLWAGSHLRCLDADEEPDEGVEDCTIPGANCASFYPGGHRFTARCMAFQSRLQVLEGHGLRPFLPNPFSADAARLHYSSGTPDMLAVAIESRVPPDELRLHPGFRRPGSGASRLNEFEACAWHAGANRCRSAPDRVEPFRDDRAHSHMAGTATHLLGSVVDGQQMTRDPLDCDNNPDWSPSTEPTLQATFDAPTDAASFQALERDSAFARDASGHLMAVAPTHRAYVAAIERAIDLNGTVVVNASFSRRGATRSYVDCDGVHTKAEAVSDLYNHGIPFFKSAGNFNNASRFPEYAALDCNVGGPGGAVAAFVVGALTSPAGQRTGGSSNGHPTQRRTLVDIAANGGPTRPCYGQTEGDWAPHYHQRLYNATSLAAPTVAGAAVTYRHYYETLPGSPTAIRMPGFLFARLLLQADRVGYTTPSAPWTEVPMTSGYDVNLGAGRLQMSLIFKEGTVGYDGDDAVHEVSLIQTRRSRAGTVCVGNGIAQIPLPEVWGFSTPLTVTAYFHDPRHAYRGSLDEISMHLMRVEGSSMTWVVDDEQLQEKMRVHYELDPAQWFLMLRGRNVTGESGGCGPGKQRVFFAFGWEPNTSPEVVPWHFE